MINQSKPVVDDYNAVLDFKRIMDIKTGWRLELDKTKQAILDKFIQDNKFEEGQKLTSHQVAEVSNYLFGEKKTNVIITGLFNRGKTFTMNNITGLLFDTGLTVNTRGISMISNCKERSLVNHNFVDSAGTNVPLNSEMIQCERNEVLKDEKFKLPEQKDFESFTEFHKQYLKDVEKVDEKAIALATINKKNMETFLLDMVFSVGDVIVIVVNNMTWNDQQFIQAMYEKVKDYNLKATNANKNLKFGRLLIVHNFKEVSDFTEFEKLKKQYVTSCFTGKVASHKVSIEGVGTKEIELFESSYPVKATHFFIGKEPEKNQISAAGDANKFYFHKLREYIALNTVDSLKELPFLITLEEKIKSNLKKYFKTVSNIEFKIENNSLVLYHPDELKLLSENIRVENFSLVSASSGYQPDLDLIATKDAAHILIDCPGMTFVKYGRDLKLQMNQFTVQFVQNKQIIVKGYRNLFLCGLVDDAIDSTDRDIYLSESEKFTEYDGEWPIRNRKYGYFENIYEANLDSYDSRAVKFDSIAPGIVQIVLLSRDEY